MCSSFEIMKNISEGLMLLVILRWCWADKRWISNLILISLLNTLNMVLLYACVKESIGKKNKKTLLFWFFINSTSVHLICKNNQTFKFKM
jgi:hypothetical protein